MPEVPFSVICFIRWRSRILNQGLSEKGLKPEIRHVLFSISELICYTKQKASLKQAPVGILQFLWYIYFPDTSKEAMYHTRFNFCCWWRNWITLNFLLFANFHFSKTARNVSDSKKCASLEFPPLSICVNILCFEVRLLIFQSHGISWAEYCASFLRRL